MQPLTKSWQIHPLITPDVEQALFTYPPILRQLLFNRDILTPDEARRYLQAQPPPGTEPENLLCMAQAVERIQFAIQNLESIAIYGGSGQGPTYPATSPTALTRATASTSRR
jgi:hypothetical protein